MIVVIRYSECRHRPDRYLARRVCRVHRVTGRESVKGPSLREALGTPESVRTAAHDRSPLGSPALSRRLNLADALSRLTLSGDTCRHASNASLRERPFTEKVCERRPLENAAGIPHGGRVRPCRARRGRLRQGHGGLPWLDAKADAGNRPERFMRASSGHAFGFGSSYHRRFEPRDGCGSESP
jgi:hypothetical protein